MVRNTPHHVEGTRNGFAERKKVSGDQSVELSSKEPQGVVDKEESSTSYHPTGRVRYVGKHPAIADPRKHDASESHDRESQPSHVLDQPIPPDVEFDDDYEPSIAPSDDVDMADTGGPEHDPESSSMDVSQLVFGLTPPPEQMIRPGNRSGIIAPLYVPTKDSGPLSSEGFEFCGSTVYLIEPMSGLSEDGSTWFPADLVKSGRLTELQAMNHLKAGVLLQPDAAHALAKELDIQIVSSRWVLTSKTIAGVADQCRARCVAQQLASGSMSAQNLGISSSTPSAESFRAFLTMIMEYDMFLYGLDISTAFLHSYLPKGYRAIVKFPSDISWAPDHYVSVYIDLARAMNGLRIASKAWLQTCTGILRSKSNLQPCQSEPTILGGMPKGSKSPTIGLIYVDDLLIGSKTVAGIKEVQQALEETLKVKVTGTLTNSSGQGGIVQFLGKEITRASHSHELLLRVPPKYLEDLFQSEPFCCDLKATTVPPDLLQLFEKGIKDPSSIVPLSDEASARYKRILGKLSWWAQSRADHSRYISLLATGQATPSNHHETALRRYLRFVRGTLHLYQKFPANLSVVEPYEGVTAISDASWGSSEHERRRSVTGGVMFWKQCLLKGFCRLQQCITLSSCEAEVIGVC